MTQNFPLIRMAIIKTKQNKKTPYTQKITSVGEDAEKLEPLCSADGNVKYYCCCRKSMAVSKKIKQLPHDPAIPLLGIYPKELKSEAHTDMYIPMFRAGLLTIAKRCKQANVHLHE